MREPRSLVSAAIISCLFCVATNIEKLKSLEPISPVVSFLKNSVISPAELYYPSCGFDLTICRNSGNSISPDPSRSTSLTSCSTSAMSLAKPRLISGPLSSVTPIQPPPSSSRLSKQAFSSLTCASVKSSTSPLPVFTSHLRVSLSSRYVPVALRVSFL